MCVKLLVQCLVQSKFLIEVNFPVSASSKQISTQAKPSYPVHFPFQLLFVLSHISHPQILYPNQTLSNVRAVSAGSYFSFLEKRVVIPTLLSFGKCQLSLLKPESQEFEIIFEKSVGLQFQAHLSKLRVYFIISLYNSKKIDVLIHWVTTHRSTFVGSALLWNVLPSISSLFETPPPWGLPCPVLNLTHFAPTVIDQLRRGHLEAEPVSSCARIFGLRAKEVNQYFSVSTNYNM